MCRVHFYISNLKQLINAQEIARQYDERTFVPTVVTDIDVLRSLEKKHEEEKKQHRKCDVPWKWEKY